MKKILGILMLLSVAKGVPPWRDFHPEWRRPVFRPDERWQPPLECPPPRIRPFVPIEHFQPPRGHHQIPEKEIRWTLCQMLEQLLELYQRQPNTRYGTCTIGWICREPQSGDTSIITADGLQMMLREPCLYYNFPNVNEDRTTEKPMSDIPVPKDPGNVNLPDDNTTFPGNNPVTPQTDDNSSPRQNGGEGLIDVRIGL